MIYISYDILKSKGGMVMKKVVAKFGLYMAVFLVGFWASALMASVFAIPIRFICGEGVLAERIAFTVITLLCAFAFIFIVAFVEGFRVRQVNFKTLIPIVLAVLVIHHVISLISGYAYTFCGPVGMLGEAIYFGDAPAIGENAERLGWYPIWWDTLILIGFQLFVYGPAVMFGEFIGVKARKRYGEKLRKRKENKI